MPTHGTFDVKFSLAKGIIVRNLGLANGTILKLLVALLGEGALGPNMYGCVPLRCCDFYPVWEHFPQFKYPRLGA